MALIKKARHWEQKITFFAGGEEETVTILLKVLPSSENKEIYRLMEHAANLARSVDENTLSSDLTDKDGDPLLDMDQKVARKVLGGWSDYTDEVGNPIPFEEEEINDFLDQEGVSEAIAKAWAQNYGEQKAKNSQTLPSGGSPPAPSKN